jgi:hypothetical protein
MKRFWLIPMTCLLAVSGACRQRTLDPVTQIIASPDFDPDSLGAVAYVGFSRGIADAEDRELFEGLVEGQVMAGEQAFAVLPRDEVRRRAQLEQAGDLLQEVRDFWRDSQKVDKFKTAELCAALGTSGILVGLIEEWTEFDTAQGSDQAPYARVIASLEIYSAATGRRIWKARTSHTVEGKTIPRDAEDSRSAALTEHERELKRRSETIRSSQRDQQAPAIEGVASAVAASLSQALQAR